MPWACGIFQCTVRQIAIIILKMRPAFDLYGVPGSSPLCISVPHAGRDYPDDIAPTLAMPLARARGLEDRHVDTIVRVATACGYPTIIARTPRLLIDLNRAETDFEPATIHGGMLAGARPSHRARGGLGLIPDRLPGAGALWRQRPSIAALTDRIATVHRPYHAHVAKMIDAARRRFGNAVLVDLHSMPPLAGPMAPEVVIGDRHGMSAAPHIVAAARAILVDRGLRVGLNTPYAGGYVLERHGRPRAHVHAIQIEVDRRLYLDSMLDLPGDGMNRIAQIVADLADALANPETGQLMAAE